LRNSDIVNTVRLKNLLRRLINIYSPSGKEEELLEFIKDYLTLHNIKFISQPVDEERENIIILPRKGEVKLAFVGHIDTVWAYDLENYTFKEEGDLIKGLGSADMKGNCAAMLEAYLSFREYVSYPVPAALVLLVGEEEYGDGAEKLVKDFHFPLAIIGEPTDLKPCFKHYGYLEVHISTQGEQMHASLARPGQNAIEDMLNILMGITRYIQNERKNLIYNIRELSSLQAGFVVSERCEARLDLHIPPEESVQNIVEDLKEILYRKKQESNQMDYLINFPTIQNGYELTEKKEIEKKLQDIFKRNDLPWHEGIFQSSSDGNILWEGGIKPVMLGAGQLEQAHRPEESISFRDICKISEIYFEILRSYCI